MNNFLQTIYTGTYISLMTISDRMQARMDALRIPSTSELSRRSDVPQPTCYRILKGKTANPDSDTLAKLALALSVSPDWLLTGRGQAPSMPDASSFALDSAHPSEKPTQAIALRRARNKLGLTQAELAVKAGVHVSGIVDMEKGESHPSLNKVCEALGLDPKSFAAGQPTSPLAMQPSESIGDRIRTALGSNPIAIEKIALAAEVEIPTVKDWISDSPTAGITVAQAVKIAEEFEINAVWILTGKGDKHARTRLIDGVNPPVVNFDYDPIPVQGFRPIPVVGMAQLGDNGHFVDMEYPVGHGDGYVRYPSDDKDAYAVRCVGDSMKPRIQHGEFAVIEPNNPIEPGDDVLIKSMDGRVMVKRFLYKRGGRTHVVSVNDAHPPIAFDDDQIEKMHFVAAICRPKMWRDAS